MLLHVSPKKVIGTLPDLSWRKPVRIGTWQPFISVYFICDNPVIKPTTFAL